MPRSGGRLSGAIGTNPADRASPPATRQAQLDAPTVDDVIRLIEAATLKGDSVLATTMALAAVTGMRRGELCALRWSDVDPELATVRPTRNLSEATPAPSTNSINSLENAWPRAWRATDTTRRGQRPPWRDRKVYRQVNRTQRVEEPAGRAQRIPLER
jgi:integrase